MGTLPIQDIEKIVQAFEQSDWRSLHLQIGDSELFLAKDVGARPPAKVGTIEVDLSSSKMPPKPAPLEQSKNSASLQPTAMGEPVPVPDGWSVVTAQSLGVFYRAPKPGAPPFVEIGQTVTAQSELCLIEVMKLFTTVRADVAGTVREICRRDGDLIELGQPLFLIEPDA